MSGPAEKLQGAAQAISTAIMVLKIEEPLFKAFLKECHDMDHFGPILDPTLYNNSERRAVSAVLEPLFQSAVDFIAAYDAHVARAKIALAKVSA
jgi:hypothetical protein